MVDGKQDLSARYYIAEATVWLLGTILMVARFVGLAPTQTLPLLNVTLEKPQHFFRVVAGLLVAAEVYLVLEWKQSSRKARASYWAAARAGLTTLWTCTSLWLCYSLITASTLFAGISPAWYFGFLAIGVLLGRFVSDLAVAALMIRSPKEAKNLRLPRVPAATRSKYKVSIPVSALLLFAYYVLCYSAPETIKGLGYLFVSLPFLLILGEEFASLCLSKDKNGKHIPYTERIARLKKIHDFHDYAYFLIDHGGKAVEEMGIPTQAAPQTIQKVIRERYSGKIPAPLFNFHVQQQEEAQFEFYCKDGNRDNHSPENRGVKIHKPRGKKGLMRVLVIPDDPTKERRELEIPTGLVETHAEEYLSKYTDVADLTFKKVFSHAINQTVIQTMVEQGAPLLHRAVEAGKTEVVEDLIKQDVDVNESAEFGWTALLYASAQGYPRIVQLLLDAGANPDIGNVHGVTPLMYGARYGNIEVCTLLLENGANPNLQDKYGMTALMVATGLGFADVGKKLLKAGADASIKDRNGMTALDFAYKHKQGPIAKILRLAQKSTPPEK
jgi:hypothetical protein